MSDQPQLKDIAAALSKLPWSQVKAMSVQLNMELSTLTQIEQQYGTFSDRTLHSMDTWLRNDPEPSWARIVAALNTIEENALAARIQQQHCHPMETPPTSPASQPVATCVDPSPPDTSFTDPISDQIPLPPSATTSQPFPHHPTPNPQSVRHVSPSPSLSPPPELSVEASQPQGLLEPRGTAAALPSPDRIEEVADQASQLQDQFVGVIINTKIEFSKKPAGFLDHLRYTLTTLPVSQRFQHLHFLRKQRQRIMNAKSIDDIFEILDDFWDYTDYALLKHLVERFGEEPLKKEMSEYVAALEQFEKGTTIQERNTASSSSRYPRRNINHNQFRFEYLYDFSTVDLQLHRDPAVYTLYDARQLEESVSKRACLEPYAVRLQRVRPSSVTITLMCPRVALELILEALEKDFLEAHQIVSVTIDEKPLEEYSEEHVKVCATS